MFRKAFQSLVGLSRPCYATCHSDNVSLPDSNCLVLENDSGPWIHTNRSLCPPTTEALAHGPALLCLQVSKYTSQGFQDGSPFSMYIYEENPLAQILVCSTSVQEATQVDELLLNPWAPVSRKSLPTVSKLGEEASQQMVKYQYLDFMVRWILKLHERCFRVYSRQDMYVNIKLRS